jgi:hypothetical protein
MVDMKAFSIRIPDQLHDRIAAAAASEFRSVNQQIEYFLTKALLDFENQNWDGRGVERLLSESERQEIASPAQPTRRGRGRPPKAAESKEPSIQAQKPPAARAAVAHPPSPPNDDEIDEDSIPPF